jgi:putative transposase
MNDQMKYNPNIHHRRSVRLQGYDYSKAGLYFITICCKDRICRLGVIENHKMIFNDIGNIADAFWRAIPEHFQQVVLHEHIVMPNHVHGIIELTGTGTPQPVDKNDNVRTRYGVSQQGDTNSIDRTCHGMSQPQPQPRDTNQPKSNQFGKPIAGSVSVIINQFKSSVKRWCNKNGHPDFEWQSRFHDHIIRDERSYWTISEYILQNPAKWNEDKFYNG